MLGVVRSPWWWAAQVRSCCRKASTKHETPTPKFPNWFEALFPEYDLPQQRQPESPLLMKWGLLCWCPNLLFTKSCILLILKELRKFLLHFNLSFLLLNLPNLKIGTHEVDPQWPMLTVDWLKKAAANNCDICTFFNLLRTTTDKNSLDFYFLSFPTWRKEISIFNNMW